MFISPLKISTLARKGGSIFSITNSFSFDGVDEYMTIPNADLSSYLQGAGKKFTFNFSIYPFAIGDTDYLFANNDFSFAIRVDTNGKVQIIGRDGAFNYALSTDFLNGNIWQFVTISYDSSLTLGNRAEIYINGILSGKSVDTMESTIDTSVVDYQIGAKDGVSSFNGSINQISVLDKVLNQTEVLDWYNNGKPKNPQTLFGTDCKFFFNPDNSGASAPFTVTDSINNINATSVNMEDADKTTVTPY